MTVPGMATAPILRQASMVSHHSGRRPTWMKTRSPFFTPFERRTLTTRLAASAISFQEIARSLPESSIQRMHRRSEDHFSNVSATKLNRDGTVSMAEILERSSAYRAASAAVVVTRCPPPGCGGPVRGPCRGLSWTRADRPAPGRLLAMVRSRCGACQERARRRRAGHGVPRPSAIGARRAPMACAGPVSSRRRSPRGVAPPPSSAVGGRSGGAAALSRRPARWSGQGREGRAPAR